MLIKAQKLSGKWEVGGGGGGVVGLGEKENAQKT